MSAKRNRIPKYGTVEINGHTYYRTIVTDSDGNRISLYAKTRAELYDKEMDTWEQIENDRFYINSPLFLITVKIGSKHKLFTFVLQR